MSNFSLTADAERHNGSMELVQTRLPLEYPVKDMLCIYAERLYVFAAVVGANCMLFMVVSFAVVHPLIFSVSLCWILLLIFACWYGERTATAYVDRLRSSRVLSPSADDSAASMAAFVGLLGLLMGEDGLGDTEHETAARQMTTPRSVRSVFEKIGRFHRDIIAPYLRGMAEKSPNEAEKQRILSWQATALKVDRQVDAALNAVPEEELSRHIVILPIAENRGRLSTYVLVEKGPEEARGRREIPFSVVRAFGDDSRRRNQLVQSYDSVDRFVSNLSVLDRMSQEDVLVLLLGYLRGAECMCEVLGECDAGQGRELIQSIRAAIQQLSSEVAVRVAERASKQSAAGRNADSRESLNGETRNGPQQP